MKSEDKFKQNKKAFDDMAPTELSGLVSFVIGCLVGCLLMWWFV